MSGDLGALNVKVSADTVNFEAGLNRADYLAKKNAESIVRSVNQIENSVKNMLASLIPTIGAGMFIEMIKGSIDTISHLNDLQAATGIAVGKLAGLQLASSQVGSNLDTTARAIDFLSKNIGKNADAYEAIGITAKDPLEAFKQLSDLFVSIQDPQERAAVMAKALGKSWQEAAPLLAMGGQALGEVVDHGEKLSGVTDENAASVKTFNDQLKELETATAGVFRAIGVDLIPIMKVILKSMQDNATDADKLANSYHPLTETVRALAITAAEAAIPWTVFGMELSKVAAILDEPFGAGYSQRIKLIADAAEAGMAQAIKSEQAFVENMKNAGGSTLPPGFVGPPRPSPSHASLSKFIGGADVKPNISPVTEDVKGLQLLIGLENTYQNELAKRQDVINAAGMSASEKALATDMRTVTEQAQKVRIKLDKMYATSPMQYSDYKNRLDEVNAAETKQIAAVKALAAEQDALNASWQYGATVALRTYLDEVQNVAKSTEALMTKAFKGMEDALVNFCMTGKLDFSSLANSIIADLIRIQIQQSITGPLAGMMLPGGALGPGSNALGPVNATGTAMTYAANGAWFDNGAAHFASGGIFDSATPFKFANGGGFSNGVMGEAGPEAVMPLTRGKDGKLGIVAQGGGKSITITHAPVYNIDSRTDRAQVRQDMIDISKQSNAMLVDKLQRQGVI